MSCLCVLGILLTACASGTQATVQHLQPCTLTTPGVNIYNSIPDTWAQTILDYGLTPTPSNNISAQQTSQQAQYAAFDFLVKQVRRWSAIDNVVLSPTREIRITVTLLHPKLIQAIYLNDILFHNIRYTDLTERTKKLLDEIAARNEILFLVTMTTTSYDETATGDNLIVLNLPVTSMTVINSNDLRIPPDDDDHGLSDNIQITQKPISGIIAYPFAVLSGDQCKWVLNPEFNKTINIIIPHLMQIMLTRDHKHGPSNMIH